MRIPRSIPHHVILLVAAMVITALAAGEPANQANPNWQPPVAAMYDLTDVLMQVKDFPPEQNGALIIAMPMTERRSSAVHAPTCAEALSKILDPALAAELEPTAELRGGNLLFLSATPVMHARVARNLAKLRHHRGLQCNTVFRQFSMSVPHRHAKYPLREFAAQGRIKELPGQSGLVLIVLTAGEVEAFTSTLEADKAVTSTSPSLTQFNNQLATFNFKQGVSIPMQAYVKTGSGVVPTQFSTGDEFCFRPSVVAEPPMIRCELSHVRSTRVGTQAIPAAEGAKASELPLVVITGERVDQLVEPDQSILVTTAISPGTEGIPVTGFLLVTPRVIDLAEGEPATPVPAPVPAQTPARSGTASF